MKEHYKMYKKGKTWLFALVLGATLVVGGGSIAQPVAAAGEPAGQSEVAANTAIVTTTDINGDLSVNPAQTGQEISVSGDTMAQNFTARSATNGDPLTIDGNDVQLTTGYETESDGENSNSYPAGIGMVVAKRQVDFTTDFHINITTNIAWDPSMSDWLGGDGTALFFEDVSPEDAPVTAQTGGQLGISYDATKLLSFNVSTNALGASPSKYYDADGSIQSWTTPGITYYTSGLNPGLALDKPVSTGIVPSEAEAGALTYTFDLSYDAAAQTITTTVYDDSGTQVARWTNDYMPKQYAGTPFSIVLTGSTADSHAAYSATFNDFSYTPIETTLDIDSTGLPAGVTGPSQTGLKGLPGDVIAFYPAGTTAPTTDKDGNAVTAAYPVNAIGNSRLDGAQFITLSSDAAQNDIELPFVTYGNVTVNYVDENGNAIAPSKKLDEALLGTPYTVEAPSIENYIYDPTAEGSSPLTGTYTAGDQQVTLVYRPSHVETTPVKAGDLTVKYVDDYGNTIKADTVRAGYVGNGYSVTAPELENYTFNKVASGSAALTGTLKADAQTITLVYTPKRGETTPVKAGDLTVKYVDDYGNTIKADTIRAGYVGNGYSVNAPELENYTFNKVASGSAALTGTLKADAQTITLVYTPKRGETTPVKAGDLTVKYVDDYGNTIKADTVRSGSVGNGYSVTAPELENYTFNKVASGSAALTGTLKADAQTITLVYTPKRGETTPVKAGDLTVKYVDDYGNAIKADTSKSGYIGNGYSVTAPELENYTFKKVASGSAALTGTLKADAQTITLVYTPKRGETTPVKAGDLTVKYVDEDGNAIAPDAVHTGSVGNGYTIALTTIKGYHYTALGAGSAALAGRLTADAQTVILVYTKDAVTPSTDPSTKPATKPESRPDTKPDSKPATTDETTTNTEDKSTTTKTSDQKSTDKKDAAASLPQTGETATEPLTVLDLVVLATSALLLGMRKQRRE
ncbi:MucBP domain-containing protein [Lacticaseibacillus mingshuiensis]|uniref:MucBP domain-containing protein n=1 Tax=Lacticaseibacillus mingshuiensis TaxID=2799574 RepID=UPI00194F911B|nr:MucBP domain-containing protein [Lacticaseibacillus mingshuiensis]